MLSVRIETRFRIEYVYFIRDTLLNAMLHPIDTRSCSTHTVIRTFLNDLHPFQILINQQLDLYRL